ncbi:16S rRNA (cytidine(1402)-2'-O)-methyltransferase [Acidomonas methanolica]|uniref:Ribosomal RNA small subunit methyltransferase I n=2 Tax=Acidomonas methanolica TaxID=437 RepID=A0A023D3S4_ACIMT|nr:16S rRNA (cytidine(1402)-2'-O)-methyltransferase [Acidomonas methanolica]MBU2653611.1 16S rRNA (cytidine(1402)-2'-O)-methyltransferase [Acidomonas methanolica]TCS31562.1 16S rRNA (cytidine1402-2'-O)-methyltransferase [Acidomonas methanolica]GAJ28777.1 tetrapyrrole/corrin/porphyrin methyltransferase [Acidomonas methanolica NBRC 104435]GEK97981.1 ribosomal RNA small subunit methyltransferase I [Acidomonas methanolica NBRC 104435]
MSDPSSSAHAPSSSSSAPDAPPPYVKSAPPATPAGKAGLLSLVATPIGNLGDISQRALDTLSHADLILCEDTRVTAKLLRHFGIAAATQTLHEHNEEERIPFLLGRLREGARIAVVSDAGMPLLSDPGYRLARAAIAAGVQVTGIPGPNAASLALALSGLPPIPSLFLGFPPPRSQARRTAFATLRAAEQAGLSATLIWYEAPHRLVETLADLTAVFGEARPAAVGRELTKRFEEMVRGSLADLAAHFAAIEPRGEITLLLGPPPDGDDGAETLDNHLRAALKTHSVKDAATLVAGFVNLPRRTIYARALELSRDDA